METGEVRAGLPRSVGVIGGGTAGYFAALALKRHFPRMEVSVVASSAVPIIGVGEATTTLMPPFLHAQLGLDVVDLYRAVKPTFKLGIKFEWGLPGDYYFTYPFGDADPVEAFGFDGDLRAQSLGSLLMGADRAPILRRTDGALRSLLPKLKFAYHLDNAPLVDLLARCAREAGIAQIDATIEQVVLHAGGSGVDRVDRVVAGGRSLSFDFWIDASGFRSLLLGEALGSPFESYATSLWCDRAIVARVPRTGPIQPYTTAETMDAGWCWRIPVAGEDHRGYVHASAFLDEAAALAEMRAKNPGMGEPWVVRFRSGRHRDWWRGNTVGLGNAYGFVEPLESTALHMVIIEIAYLLAGLEAMREAPAPGFTAFANRAVGAHWDYLRWFLAVHYKFNRRLDSPFWRAARAEVDVSGLGEALGRFGREGPWLATEGRAFEVGDPAFGYGGLMMMLLGQRVPAPIRASGSLTRRQWQDRVRGQARLVAAALPQAEALEVLSKRPELLRAFAESPSSWCRGDAERVSVPPRSFAAVHPKGGMPPAPELLRSATDAGRRRP